jgi:hypothetical protein
LGSLDYPEKRARPGTISEHNQDIYHLLSRAFRQCVAIPQVIDFDIFDIVTILLVNLSIDLANALSRGRPVFCYRTFGLTDLVRTAGIDCGEQHSSLQNEWAGRRHVECLFEPVARH